MNKKHDTWFIETLQLIFISFRIAGIIDWSWVWVLAPTWGSLVIGLIMAVGKSLKQ
jgi:hypothetical protein